MLKIMIIDDEYYFRQALKVSLPFEDLGFVICGEAKNGKEALEKIDELNPDIAIVDINMPIVAKVITGQLSCFKPRESICIDPANSKNPSILSSSRCRKSIPVITFISGAVS